jgi:hypothetical protein
MFLPLANCGYVYDTRTKDVFFKADIEKNIPFNLAVKRLPTTFVAAPAIGLELFGVRPRLFGINRGGQRQRTSKS